MKIPNKIEKCPIRDCVVEIRFETDLFSNAIFGIIYKDLQPYFPKVEKLPLLQIPEQVLEKDPSFKYKTHYKLTNKDNYSIQIGPRVLLIGSVIPYNGWEDYSRFIYKTLEIIFSTNVIKKVLRLGFRVINFFDDDEFKEDIFEGIKLGLKIGDFENELKNTTIRTQIDINGFTNTVQLVNSANMTKEGVSKFGSLFDIDSFKEYSTENFIKNFHDEIEKVHQTEKELFFSLLEDKFLKTLNPIYD